MLFWVARRNVLPTLDPQRVLRVYTPGIRLNRPLSEATVRAYQFEIGSNLGYREASATLRDGLSLDRVQLLGAQPRGARAVADGIVWQVDLTTTDPRAASRLSKRLRETLGRPETRCEPDGTRLSFWDAADRGGTTLEVSAKPGAFRATVSVASMAGQYRFRRAVKCR